MALLGSLLWDSFAALAIVVVIAYLYFASILKHFEKRNIPYVKGLPIVGNYLGVLTGRYTVNNIVRPLYEELKKHKFGGFFQGTRPVVMLCDPELIKLALTKDFSSLHDRGLPFDEINDPLSATLFNITGARWKNLRMKLSPVFTSGKLKQMFPLIKAVSETLSAELLKSAEKGDHVELKSLLTRFSTDVVGTCAFGVECNCVKDPKSPFFTMSQSILKPNLLVLIRFSFLVNSKFFSRLIPFKAMFPNVQDFFVNLMKDTIKYRKENNYDRNDFVKLLMQQQKNDEGKTPEEHPEEVVFTDMIIVAQAFLFFIAGLDSQAGTVGFALHHLCVDPRLQEDLADEIASVVSHHNGEITYEGLKEMKLLGMVVNEVMRMYTPVGFLFREVTAPKFPIPGSSVVLKKGDRVSIPVEGLHNDPEFFPEPEKFDPYRFTEEAISKRHPYSYIPFGEGPRVCIAERFARLQMELCVAQLIKDFKFSVCSKTQIPMKLKTRSFTVTPTEGFYFKIEKRAV